MKVVASAFQLLNGIQRALEVHPHVIAAWLSGSRGRGTADNLSDIDIWLAIEDDAVESIAADPLAFVHAIAPTIMHIQAPSIAPPGGAFVLTWIPTDAGFEQVDWYFTPESDALRAADTRILFEKRGTIPVAEDGTQRLSSNEIEREIEGATKDALLMISNGWKHMARGNSWRALDHIKSAFLSLEKVFWLLEFGEIPTFDRPGRKMRPQELPVTPDQQRAELIRCHQMLADYLTRLGRPLPYPEAFTAVKNLLNTSPKARVIVDGS